MMGGSSWQGQSRSNGGNRNAHDHASAELRRAVPPPFLARGPNIQPDSNIIFLSSTPALPPLPSPTTRPLDYFERVSGSIVHGQIDDIGFLEFLARRLPPHLSDAFGCHPEAVEYLSGGTSGLFE